MKRQVGRRVGMRRRPTVFRPRPDVIGYAADFALPLPGSPSQVAFDAQHAAVAGHGTAAAAPRDDMIRLHVPPPRSKRFLQIPQQPFCASYAESLSDSENARMESRRSSDAAGSSMSTYSYTPCLRVTSESEAGRKPASQAPSDRNDTHDTCHTAHPNRLDVHATALSNHRYLCLWQDLNYG